MNRQSQKSLSERITIWILIAVVAIWIAFAQFVARGIFESDNTLERTGLFGDSFGFLNSIFTGLALGGIAYTAILQRAQLNAQQQEIQSQSEEAAQTRMSLARERREQFLSARLQATAALLPSYDANSPKPVGSKHDDAYLLERILWNRRLARLQIEFLLKEAWQGFEKDFSPFVQAQSIRETVADFLEGLRDFDRRRTKHHSDWMPPARDYRLDIEMELHAVVELIRPTHTLLAEYLLDRLNRYCLDDDALGDEAYGRRELMIRFIEETAGRLLDANAWNKPIIKATGTLTDPPQTPQIIPG